MIFPMKALAWASIVNLLSSSSSGNAFVLPNSSRIPKNGQVPNLTNTNRISHRENASRTTLSLFDRKEDVDIKPPPTPPPPPEDLDDLEERLQVSVDPVRSSPPQRPLTPEEEKQMVAAAIGGLFVGGFLGVLVDIKNPDIDLYVSPVIPPAIGALSLSAFGFVAGGTDGGLGTVIRTTLGGSTIAVGNGIVAVIRGAANSAVNSVTNIVTETTDGIKAIPSNIQKAAIQKVEDTKDEIVAIPGKLQTAAFNTATGIAEEIKATPGKVAQRTKQVVEDAVDDTLDAVEDFVDDVKALPKRAFDGVEESINSLIGKPPPPRPPLAPPDVQPKKEEEKPLIPQIESLKVEMPKLEMPKIGVPDISIPTLGVPRPPPKPKEAPKPKLPPPKKEPSKPIASDDRTDKVKLSSVRKDILFDEKSGRFFEMGSAKIETPKIEVPKLETPNIELPKLEIPKIGLPTPELKSVEGKPKPDAVAARKVAERKKAEEERKKIEEESKLAAQKRQEEAKAKAEEIARQKAEAAEKSRRAAEERKQAQEQAAEQRRQEAEARKQAQEQERKEKSEAQARAAERRRQEAESRKLAQERERKEKLEAQARAAEQRKQQAEERRKQVEAARQKELEKKQLELEERKASSERMKRQQEAGKTLDKAKSRTTISLAGLFGLGTGEDSKEAAPLSSPKAPPQPKLSPPRGVPVLSSWRQNSDGSITGKITGSSSFSDGEGVTTSPVAKGATSGTVVKTTSGSRYFLSEQASFGFSFGGIAPPPTSEPTVDRQEEARRVAEEKKAAAEAAAEKRRKEAEERKAAAEAAAEKRRIEAQERKAAAEAAAEKRRKEIEERKAATEAAAEAKRRAAEEKKAAAEAKKREVEEEKKKAAEQRRVSAAAAAVERQKASAKGAEITKKRPSLSLPRPSLSIPKPTKPPRGVPVIKSWKKRADGGVSGRIYDSRSFEDGDFVETSPITKGSIENGSVVSTKSGSRYFLSAEPAMKKSNMLSAIKDLAGAEPGATITLTRERKEREAKAAAKSIEQAKPRSTFSLFGLGFGEADEGLSSKETSPSRDVPRPPAPKKVTPPPPPQKAAPKKAAPAPTPKAVTAPRGVPTLSRWSKNSDGSITGIISGSRSFNDGERVTTSPIKNGKIAKKEVVVTGSGSRYFLS